MNFRAEVDKLTYPTVHQTTDSMEITPSDKPGSSNDIVQSLSERLSFGSRKSEQKWLKATLNDSSGGRKVEIFEITHQRPQQINATACGGKRQQALTGHSKGQTTTLRINQQATVNVCRHVIDTLIILAKSMFIIKNSLLLFIFMFIYFFYNLARHCF